jgi:hypothetical protein
VTDILKHFRNRENQPRGQHERVFQTTLRFDAERDAVVLRAEVLSLPLTNAEPRLCSILDRHAQQLSSSLPPVERFSTRVRELGAGPSAAGTA